VDYDYIYVGKNSFEIKSGCNIVRVVCLMKSNRKAFEKIRHKVYIKNATYVEVINFAMKSGLFVMGKSKIDSRR
jgi:4-hydroxy-3-methylbut-2-en-1-yl diphosphate synthase IspG/GcpE